MMRTESAIRALLAAVEPALAGRASIERNPDRPDVVGEGGAVFLRDGEQTQALPMFSPLQYEIGHAPEFTIAAADETERSELLELLVSAIEADRTLGGAVLELEFGAPLFDLAEYEGAEAGRTAALPVVLYFMAPTAAG